MTAVDDQIEARLANIRRQLFTPASAAVGPSTQADDAGELPDDAAEVSAADESGPQAGPASAVTAALVPRVEPIRARSRLTAATTPAVGRPPDGPMVVSEPVTVAEPVTGDGPADLPEPVTVAGSVDLAQPVTVTGAEEPGGVVAPAPSGATATGASGRRAGAARRAPADIAAILRGKWPAEPPPGDDSS